MTGRWDDLQAVAERIRAEAANGSAPGGGEQAGSGDRPGRIVELQQASSVVMQRTTWAWEGRIPLGALTLLAGQEGSGKTTVAIDRAARLTRGQLPGALYGKPCAVVMATTEDSWSRTLVPRFLAAGADLDLVHIVVVNGMAGGLAVPGDLDRLGAEVKRVGARLLILDPLGEHLDARLDTHRDAAVRQALGPLAARLGAWDAAGLGLLHWRKAAANVVLDRVNGSRAFTAACRSMLGVGNDAESGVKLLVLAKANLGPLALPALRYRVESRFVPAPDAGEPLLTSGIAWCGEVAGLDPDMVLRTHDPEQATRLDAAVEWLADYMAEAGGRAKVKAAYAAAREAGHSDRTLRRAQEQLSIDLKREGKGASHVGWWQLPNYSGQTFDGEDTGQSSGTVPELGEHVENGPSEEHSGQTEYLARVTESAGSEPESDDGTGKPEGGSDGESEGAHLDSLWDAEEVGR